MVNASDAEVVVDLDAEAEPHLRAILETLPVVLTRVSREGTLLAINEAGLSMLGAQALDQVLGASLVNMVAPEAREACQAFVDRAVNGTRGSFEADLVGLTGTRRTLEFHASAHPGAADGISSALISFRDVTRSRSLESSLVDAAASHARQEATREAECTRLAAELELARHAEPDQRATEEQIRGLEQRLAAAEEERAAIERELESGIAMAREQSGRIDELESEQAQLRARFEAQLSALQQSHATELETLRVAHEAEQAARDAAEAALREVQKQYETDTTALRDALNESMADHARLADITAAAEREAAGKADQLAAARQALDAEIASRTAIEQSYRQTQAAIERFVAEAGRAIDGTR